MPFSNEAGYTPSSFETIMSSIRERVNAQFGTSYTAESFVGTNFYKYYYALAQGMQENEIKTSEIFLKLQQYFGLTNEKISRPVVTNPGLIDRLSTAGYIASVKPMIEADAGKIHVAVDVDETAPGYAAKKLEINTILAQSTVAGAVTQGTEVSTIVLSNGQAFDFKYALPDRHTTLLRLTITTSDNNLILVGNPDDTKAKLLANIAARYRLGLDFEPQRYFTQVDAPWASQVLLEYSLNGGSSWSSSIYESEFDDKIVVSLANTTLVEN